MECPFCGEAPLPFPHFAPQNGGKLVKESKLPGGIFSLKILSGEKFVGTRKE
jgi:hypothetical protein